MKTSLVVLSFLMLLGTGAFAQQPANPPKKAETSVAMTISTDNETVAPGSKVILTIQLTNVSDQALSFSRIGIGG